MSNQTSLRAHSKLELIFMVFLSVNLELGKAFVICEDFDQNFHPLNLKTPKCLLPIANREPLGRSQKSDILFGLQIKEASNFE